MSVELSQTKKMSFNLMRRRAEVALKDISSKSQGVLNFNSKFKPMGRLFTMKEVEKMVGKSRSTILEALEAIESKIRSGEIAEDHLRPLLRHQGSGNVAGYQFEWVEAIRNELGVSFARAPDTDDPFILAVIQFKGGAGKTETATNLSRRLALTGKKVLVVDMDHQGSATGSFGFTPDENFTVEDTVMPYIEGDQETLDYAIKKTAWPNIDIIPGCMALENFSWMLSEHAFSLETGDERKELYYDLKAGIDTVKDNYDVVIIDSPPSSSIISFSIIAAADGLVIPVPPRKHDLASTVQFMGIVERLVEGEGVLNDKNFSFVRYLVTQFTNEGNRSSNDKDYMKLYQQAWGDSVYPLPFRMSSSIKEAASQFTTVYEMEEPNRPLLKELDLVFGQVELDILRTFPSKEKEAASLELAINKEVERRAKDEERKARERAAKLEGAQQSVDAGNVSEEVAHG